MFNLWGSNYYRNWPRRCRLAVISRILWRRRKETKIQGEEDVTQPVAFLTTVPCTFH
jgi:hypothetical protein